MRATGRLQNRHLRILIGAALAGSLLVGPSAAASPPTSAGDEDLATSPGGDGRGTVSIVETGAQPVVTRGATLVNELRGAFLADHRLDMVGAALDVDLSTRLHEAFLIEHAADVG